MITIISPTRIEVDGKDAGLPLEYYFNNPTQRPQVQAAFVAWHASHVQREQARDAEIATTKATLEAAHDARLAEITVKEQRAQEVITACGDEETVATIIKNHKRTELAERIAKLEAEAAALENEPARIK